MHTSAKIIGTILIVLSTHPLLGQDIHFSQYFNSPLSLNPAETGNFEGDWRGILNYRDQWQAIAVPYKTFSASYDQQFYFKKQRFSPGFYILNDNSGNAALNVFKIYGSLAYHKELDYNSISAGLQIGYIHQSVNPTKLTFPANYNNDLGIFDPTYGMEHTVTDITNSSYLDINFGASWKRKFDGFEPEAGFAVYHLNHPKQSFFRDPNARLPLRSAFNASVKKYMNRNLYLKPGIMFVTMQGTHDMMIGGQAGITVQGNQFNVKEAFAGLYMRNGIADLIDAFMVMGGAQVNNITINISYDINVSGLSAYSNHRGAFELSLIFKNISAVIKTFTLPCERI